MSCNQEDANAIDDCPLTLLSHLLSDDNLDVQSSNNGDIINNNTITNNHLNQYANGVYINNGGPQYHQDMYDNGCLMLSNHCANGTIKSEVDSEGESNQSFTLTNVSNNVYCLDTMVTQSELLCLFCLLLNRLLYVFSL